MKDGQRHGKGTMNYANGAKYNGIWVNGNRTGQGIYIYTDGILMEVATRDNPKTIKSMARVPMFGDQTVNRQVIDTREIGLTTCEQAKDFTFMLMEIATRDSIKTMKSMARVPMFGHQTVKG